MEEVFDIITVTYNCEKYLENFINGLFNTTDRAFKLYIFDNNSQDNTVSILNKYALKKSDIDITYSNQNINYGPANNYLVKEKCKNEHILLLNNDIEFKKGWCENLFECIYETNADVIGAKLLYPDNTIQHCGIKFDICGMPHHIFRFASRDLLEVNHRKEYPNVTAACMLMKRKDFIEVGGFDDKYINGFEDNDLCMKLILQKKKIFYEPKCELIHYESVAPGIGDYKKICGNYFFEKWKHCTLELGKEILKKINNKSKVSIFGAGEKSKQVLNILKNYKYEIENIYDRERKKVEFWDKYIRDINDMINDAPEYVIIASIYQYKIIKEFSVEMRNINFIPVCAF